MSDGTWILLSFLGILGGSGIAVLGFFVTWYLLQQRRGNRELGEEQKAIGGPLRDLFKALQNVKNWHRDSGGEPWILKNNGRLGVHAKTGEVLLEWADDVRKTVVLDPAEQRVVKKFALGIITRLEKIQRDKVRREMLERLADGEA